ncbi:MAG: hypothetical protein RL215_1743, partial [Planctomycetota bacterium]
MSLRCRLPAASLHLLDRRNFLADSRSLLSGAALAALLANE